jgi:hypothetical protein
MRFPYLAKALRRPVYSLGGAKVIYLPMFGVTILSPNGPVSVDGLVDSGSTDVIFPLTTAQACGIDLTNAPVGEAQQAGGATLPFRYAHVRLRVSDGQEACEWDSIVGFLKSPKRRHALLGHAGFLDFFDVQLRGAAKETLVDPNAAFPGQRTQLSP